MPTLLINADDFGLHPDIDRGILACISANRMTGISVCANGPSTDWSVVRDLAGRGIDIGVHVTLVGERWLTKPLAFANWTRLMPWIMLPGRRGVLEREIRAQIEAFRINGVTPTHLDSHQHVHVMTPIWGVCRSLAAEYGSLRVRVPRAPALSVAKQSIAGRILERLSQRRAQARSSTSSRLGPACIGIAHAGHNTDAIYARELTASKSVDIEVVSHPGFNTESLQGTYADWKFDWDAEREALLSEHFGETCQALGYAIGGDRPRYSPHEEC